MARDIIDPIQDYSGRQFKFPEHDNILVTLTNIGYDMSRLELDVMFDSAYKDVQLRMMGPAENIIQYLNNNMIPQRVQIKKKLWRHV